MELEELSLLAASRVASFPLLLPSSLPNGCQLNSMASVRVEREPRTGVNPPVWSSKTPLAVGELRATDWSSGGQPFWTTMRNSCVVLNVVDESSNRALRLKEYLFLDYGPHPTHHAMIPPVGNYRAKVAQAPEPQIEFSVSNRACGWIGYDYAGLRCAQLMLCGTCVEVRVIAGTFDDEELIAVCRSLQPMDDASDMEGGLGVMRARSFARDTYYARHPATTHGFLVPSSLLEGDVSNFGLPHCAYPNWWAFDLASLADHARAPLIRTTRPSAGGLHAPAEQRALPKGVPERLPFGLLLDSLGVLGGTDGGGGSDGEGADGEGGAGMAKEPMEMFALYAAEGRDAMAWVRVVRGVGPCAEAPRWPPSLGSYPCEGPIRRHDDICGCEVLYTAHARAATGPHDAIFCVAEHGKEDGGSHAPGNGAAGGPLVFVHATPRPGLDVDAFLQVVNAVVQAHK